MSEDTFGIEQVINKIDMQNIQVICDWFDINLAEDLDN
jgi:hypothetical protein